MTPAAVVVMELRLVVGDGGSGNDGIAEGDDDTERSGRSMHDRRVSTVADRTRRQWPSRRFLGRLVVGWSVPSACIGHRNWTVMASVPQHQAVPSASSRHRCCYCCCCCRCCRLWWHRQPSSRSHGLVGSSGPSRRHRQPWHLQPWWAVPSASAAMVDCPVGRLFPRPSFEVSV